MYLSFPRISDLRADSKIVAIGIVSVNGLDQILLFFDAHYSSKQTYNLQQMLSLRPQSHMPLSVAALCFVPYTSRYSCYTRAVRLGLADSPSLHPYALATMPSVAAREMLTRVHVLRFRRTGALLQLQINVPDRLPTCGTASGHDCL